MWKDAHGNSSYPHETKTPEGFKVITSWAKGTVPRMRGLDTMHHAPKWARFHE